MFATAERTVNDPNGDVYDFRKDPTNIKILNIFMPKLTGEEQCSFVVIGCGEDVKSACKNGMSFTNRIHASGTNPRVFFSPETMERVLKHFHLDELYNVKISESKKFVSVETSATAIFNAVDSKGSYIHANGPKVEVIIKAATYHETGDDQATGKKRFNYEMSARLHRKPDEIFAAEIMSPRQAAYFAIQGWSIRLGLRSEYIYLPVNRLVKLHKELNIMYPKMGEFCTNCGASGAYLSFSSVECANPNCCHYCLVQSVKSTTEALSASSAFVES